MTCTNTNHETVALILSEEFTKRINESRLCPESVVEIGVSLVASAVEKVEGEAAAFQICELISDFINNKEGRPSDSST